MSLFNSPSGGQASSGVGQQAATALTNAIPQLGTALKTATGPNGVPLWDAQPASPGPMAAALGGDMPAPTPAPAPPTPAESPMAPLADLAARTVPQPSPALPVPQTDTPASGGDSSPFNKMLSTLFSRAPGQSMGGWGQQNAG